MRTAEHGTEIHHLQHIQPEVAQIIVHRCFEFRRGKCRVPGRIGAAAGADFGDDDEVVRIGMQRFADQLVGDVRTIKIAGVDMVDAACHRRPQHRDRRVMVFRRSEHAGAGKLHGPVTEAVYLPGAELETAGSADVGHLGSPWGLTDGQ